MSVRRRTKHALARLVPHLHYCRPRAQSELFLTFDDGPHPRSLDLLELLDKHRVVGTFFVLGERICGREEVLRAIARQGHGIGSHSYSHRSARQLSTSELIDEQLRFHNEVRRVVPGWRSRLIRPPYGHFTWNYLAWTRRAGLQIILWSRDAKDYCARSVDEVRCNLGQVRSGDFLLFHDQFRVTLQALDRLIPEYKDRGYRFATLEPPAAEPAPPEDDLPVHLHRLPEHAAPPPRRSQRF